MRILALRSLLLVRSIRWVSLSDYAQETFRSRTGLDNTASPRWHLLPQISPAGPIINTRNARPRSGPASGGLTEGSPLM
jgi:hypothetical protein